VEVTEKLERKDELRRRHSWLSQPRLEAEPVNQSYNLHIANTDNYHPEFDCTMINNFAHGTGTEAGNDQLSPAVETTFESLETAPNVTKTMVRPVSARRHVTCALSFQPPREGSRPEARKRHVRCLQGSCLPPISLL